MDKKIKIIHAKICPRCKSVNIKISTTLGSAGPAIGAPTLYRCLECGFTSPSFPEIDLEIPDKKKNKEK